MKKTLGRIDGLGIGATALAFLATALVYQRLPERVAIHFDLAGTPDGFMPRAAAGWGFPLFVAAMWALVRFSPSVLPSIERKRLDPRTASVVAAILAFFLLVLHLTILYGALDADFSVARWVWPAVGALFVALGLVLPRLKRNAVVGVRTPWTLSSDENWARTQRVGGYAMVIGGLGAGAFGIAGGVAGGNAALACILVASLVPAAYSFVLARRQDRGA